MKQEFYNKQNNAWRWNNAYENYFGMYGMQTA